MENVDLLHIDHYISQFLHILVDYLPRIISATLIAIIGWWGIKLIKKVVQQVMAKKQMEVTLINFLSDVLIWILKVLLFVTVVSRLGIETSSFVALLGAAGLAVGLSLQGSLSNFAGGMLIILFKPFKVGDVIEAQGVVGTVKEIQIFVTRLASADNQTIFVPNGALSNNNIINYSSEGNRRADLSIGISYGADIKQAKEIITDILKNNPLVLQNPEPTVSVRDLADNAIYLAIRPWATTDTFWAMRSSVLEECRIAFDANSIVIHHPQREILTKRI
jgi:small conductance mechanosensitive channel